MALSPRRAGRGYPRARGDGSKDRAGDDALHHRLLHAAPGRRRPEVVPQGAVNFAFIGQFAESKQHDCIFTTEYSVRTPMEAVYTLMQVERGVPEVFSSTYDIRTLLAAIGPLRDGKGIDIPGPSFLRKLLMKKLEGTEIAQLLEEFHVISE